MDSLTIEARLRGLEARLAVLERGTRKPAQAKTIAERISSVALDDLQGERVMSIREFCERFRMSRSSFYNLLHQGRGPELVRANGRPTVSYEAARKWRERHEKAEAIEPEGEGDDAGMP
jgi:hypothetical protein